MCQTKQNPRICLSFRPDSQPAWATWKGQIATKKTGGELASSDLTSLEFQIHTSEQSCSCKSDYCFCVSQPSPFLLPTIHSWLLYSKKEESYKLEQMRRESKCYSQSSASKDCRTGEGEEAMDASCFVLSILGTSLPYGHLFFLSELTWHGASP